MGDVVRDVPRQIAANGDHVSVLTPAYNRLHKIGQLVTNLIFNFRGVNYEAFLYEVPPKKYFNNIKHYVIHHPEIKSGNIADIYFNDADQPFYTDACMFSLFCTAAAQAIQQEAFGEKIDIVHLHDWHVSLMLFLKKYHADFYKLKESKFIYTIHNLAIQGIRPFDGNYSSLKAFYPQMEWFDYDKLKDYRYQDCINMMAIGIRLADVVHTVSPSYKEDIQQPSNWPHFIGGEGLEHDLTVANNEGRLYGILNGANYNNIRIAETGFLYDNAINAIFNWLEDIEKSYKHSFYYIPVKK